MACERYSELMMKYMDGLLDDFENMNLERHIQACEACREDFAVYKELLEGFNHNNMEIIEAPEGFTRAVMAEIEGINLYFPEKVRNKGKILDGVIFVLWGVLVGAFAVGTILFLHQEQIFAWLHGNNLPALARAIYPFAVFVTGFGEVAAQYLTGAAEWFSVGTRDYAVVFLLVFVVLAAALFQISPKPKYAKVKKK